MCFLPTETGTVITKALVDGHFNMSEGTELISRVCLIYTSTLLLQPNKLEIQHCANLVTQDHTNYLSFAAASLNESTLSYEFQLEKKGTFFQDGYTGTYWFQFSFKAIVKAVSYSKWKLLHDQSIIEVTYQSVKCLITKICFQLLNITKSSSESESVIVNPYEGK